MRPFPAACWNEISTFSDTILDNISSKDSGFVGEVLTDLMLKVKSLKVDKLTSGESFLEKIPILNNFVSGVKKFIAKYEKLGVQIDTISDELEKKCRDISVQSPKGYLPVGLYR